MIVDASLTARGQVSSTRNCEEAWVLTIFCMFGEDNSAGCVDQTIQVQSVLSRELEGCVMESGRGGQDCLRSGPLVMGRKAM